LKLIKKARKANARGEGKREIKEKGKWKRYTNKREGKKRKGKVKTKLTGIIFLQRLPKNCPIFM
jgi:hypothetical protein